MMRWASTAPTQLELGHLLILGLPELLVDHIDPLQEALIAGSSSSSSRVEPRRDAAIALSPCPRRSMKGAGVAATIGNRQP
jgi:hypothetical protein